MSAIPPVMCPSVRPSVGGGPPPRRPIIVDLRRSERSETRLQHRSNLRVTLKCPTVDHLSGGLARVIERGGVRSARAKERPTEGGGPVRATRIRHLYINLRTEIAVNKGDILYAILGRHTRSLRHCLQLHGLHLHVRRLRLRLACFVCSFHC